MNHKRRRPKNRRGGCLLCKPWKANGATIKTRIRPGLRRLDVTPDSELDYIYDERYFEAMRLQRELP